MLFRSARGVAASVAAVFVAELLVFVALVGRFGLPTVSLISIVATAIGVRYLVRSAPGAIAQSLQDIADAAFGTEYLKSEYLEPESVTPSADVAVADRALRMAGAVLLAFPGLMTAAMGTLLFVGPVRRLFVSSLGSRLSGLLPAGALSGHSFKRRRDVVDATATVKDPARPPASPAQRAPAQSESPAQLPKQAHELP